VIAENYGHKIIWLPPYHPMLNPIETAWAIVKNYVALHNDGTNFEAVHKLVLEGMDKATSEVWNKLVVRTVREENNFILKDGIDIAIEVNEASENVMLDSEDVEMEEDDGYYTTDDDFDEVGGDSCVL
jgi:hypothetical protein